MFCCLARVRHLFFTFSIAVILSISILPTTASAAASFVRASTNKATGSAGTHTMTVTLSGTPTAGNLLIAALSLKNQPAATPTMSGWSTRDAICASGNIACTYVFTKLAVGNESSVSVSINSTGVTYSAIMTVLEYSGATNTYITAVTNNGSSSDTVVSGSVNPARDNSMLFAVVTQNNGTAYTSPGTSPDPTTGWAKRTDEKNTATYALNIGYFDRLTGNASGTSYSITPTISGQAAEWSAIIFNFDSAASAVSDIAVTNTVNNATPAVSTNVTFTITATNNGSSDNTGVVMTNTLPSGLTYVSSSPAAGTSFNSTTGVWTIGGLANGESKVLTITALVGSDQSGNTLTNSASVTAADVTDSTSGNNSANRSISVLVTPTMSSLSPSDGSSNVSGSANLALTFNTSMAAGTGNIEIYCDGSIEQTIDATDGSVTYSSSTVTINPSTDLPLGVDCYILIDAGALQTAAGNAFSGIASSATWNFSTAAVPTYIISSLPASITSRTNSDENPASQGQNGNTSVRFRKTVGLSAVLISGVTVNFSQHRNCSTSTFDTNVTDVSNLPTTPKSVMHLQSTCGEASGQTHTLYILQGSSDRVRVCPEATTLEEVNESCSSGVVLADGESTTISDQLVTATFDISIDGQTYIRVTGLVGSGGQGESSGGGTGGGVPDIGFMALSFLVMSGWYMTQRMKSVVV